jgi:hypothetical protein
MEIETKWRILNEVILDLPEEYIRQVKINYDAKLISIVFLEKVKEFKANNDNKIVFSELKYYSYEMNDIYYLISKFSYILMVNNYSVSYFPNYKKDGYNLFINNMMFSLHLEDDMITIEFINEQKPLSILN